jgi:large subunit ribosomal protein L15
MVSRTKKFRGSRTHGRGKKHGRGHGDRGGTGNAGLHKHKFVWMLVNEPDHFGAHGFVRHHHGEGETLSINVDDLDRRLEAFVEKGFAAKAGDAYEVDLGKAGYGKLLGNGRATHALKITVAVATEAAKAKVEAAGGTVTTTETAN